MASGLLTCASRQEWKTFLLRGYPDDVGGVGGLVVGDLLFKTHRNVGGVPCCGASSPAQLLSVLSGSNGERLMENAGNAVAARTKTQQTETVRRFGSIGSARQQGNAVNDAYRWLISRVSPKLKSS